MSINYFWLCGAIWTTLALVMYSVMLKEMREDDNNPNKK